MIIPTQKISAECYCQVPLILRNIIYFARILKIAEQKSSQKNLYIILLTNILIGETQINHSIAQL